MAMISCPECEQKISDLASACPGCGYPINVKASNQKGLGENQLDEETLGRIASYQRIILLCVLAYIMLIVFQFFIPPEYRFLLIGALGITAVTAMIGVFLLSVQVYNVGLGIVLGILTLIPLIGLFVLLTINGKATSILRMHGIHVGLLGADFSRRQ